MFICKIYGGHKWNEYICHYNYLLYNSIFAILALNDFFEMRHIFVYKSFWPAGQNISGRCANKVQYSDYLIHGVGIGVRDWNLFQYHLGYYGSFLFVEFVNEKAQRMIESSSSDGVLAKKFANRKHKRRIINHHCEQK